jgi:predicted MFS family arabinose efflux permease
MRLSALAAPVVMAGVTLTLLALGMQSELITVAIVFTLVGVGFGFRTNVTLTVAMDFCEAPAIAFTYSVLMAVANLGISSGAWISGQLVASAGFRTTFAVMASVNVLSIACAVFMFRALSRRRERQDRERDMTFVLELSNDDKDELLTAASAAELQPRSLSVSLDEPDRTMKE